MTKSSACSSAVSAVSAVLVLVLTACGPDPAGAPSSADGGIPERTSISPFDDEHPALSRLDPALLRAVQQAAGAARADGVELKVTSGWRSKDYQQRLLAAGVEKYGSLARAREFVNTPEKSTHVSGQAVDIGPTDAADWVVRHGSDHGLCQTYANEMWHFELRTTPGGDCPVPSSDAG
ncbi:MAG: M15 family metallopeptidase [Kibdelosporangium sp.]